jgi:hypothetical protein
MILVAAQDGIDTTVKKKSNDYQINVSQNQPLYCQNIREVSHIVTVSTESDGLKSYFVKVLFF